MYDSPITIVYDDIETEFKEKTESLIVRCVQNVGIDVDKEELIRALNYDRQQYEKGYTDGRADSQRVTGRWISVGGALYQCDQCGVVSLKRKFCSECGADMRGG